MTSLLKDEDTLLLKPTKSTIDEVSPVAEYDEDTILVKDLPEEEVGLPSSNKLEINEDTLVLDDTGVPIEKPIAEEEPSIGDKFLKGIQRDLAPWSMSKKEILEGPGVAEMAGNVLSAMGTYAVGAKAGAMIGGAIGGPAAPMTALIGGIIGGVAVGLYKGLSTEASMAKAQEREFSPFKAGISIAVEVNPLLGKGRSRLFKALSQAALQGAETQAHFDDWKRTAMSAGIAGGLTRLLTPKQEASLADLASHVAKRTASNPGGRLTTHETIGVTDMLLDAAQESDKIMEKELARNPKADLIPSNWLAGILTREAPNDAEFGSFLGSLVNVNYISKPKGSLATGDHALFEQAMEKALRLGKEGLMEAHQRWWRGNIYKETAIKNSIKYARETGVPLEDIMGSRRLAKFYDQQFIVRLIDDKSGLNTHRTYQMMIEAENEFQIHTGIFRKEVVSIIKEGKKAGLSSKDIGKALHFPKKYDKMNPNQKKVIEKARALTDSIFDAQLEKGRIRADTYRTNYFPESEIPLPEKVHILQKEYLRLHSLYGNKLVKEKAATQLMSIMTRVNGGKPIKNPKDIPALILKLLDAPPKSKIGLEASAIFKREGTVPAIIKDWDFGRVMNNHINMNLRPMYFDDALHRARVEIDILNGIGMPKTAEMYTTWTKHMSLAPSVQRAITNVRRNRTRFVALELLDSDKTFDKVRGNLLYHYQDAVDLAIGSIYPNVLGIASGNVHAPLRNLTQNLLVTAPEIGGKLGYTLTGRSYLRAVKDIKKYGVKQIGDFLKAKGLHPGQQLMEGAEEVSESLGKLKTGYEKFAQWSMKLYTQSDQINRYISYNTGIDLAQIIAGKGKYRNAKTYQSALKFIDNLPLGVKADITKLIRTNKQEELGDYLGRYLVGKTQFNYNKASMSEFGREYGKLASMFTKWPMMVAGDMGELYRKNGITKGTFQIMRKYMAPYAALYGMEQMVEEAKLIDNPAAKLAYGKGFTGAHPVMSVVSWNIPPALDLGIQVLQDAKRVISGEKPSAATARQLKKFIPVFGSVDTAVSRIEKASQ